MNVDQLLDDLSGPRESFERALGRVQEVRPGELLVPLLNELQDTEFSDGSERERRFASVFARMSLAPADLVSLGEAGATLTNSVLRNAVAQLLPPEYRRLVFRGSSPRGDGPSTLTISMGDTLTPPDDHVTSQMLPDRAPHASFSDVIILSISDDPATKKLLEGANFTPLRCQSLERLDAMLATNEDICGFLVESSFLASLSNGQQCTLIDRLGRFSTFVWLRFEDGSLVENSPAVSSRIARARCQISGPGVTHASFQEKSGLRERELPHLDNARKRLRDGEPYGLFRPGELKPMELKLLGAAMSQYSRMRNFNEGLQLTRVETKFLVGGQAGAQVAQVRVDDLQVPVIVKIANKDSILDEAHRFLTFIHKDNIELHPEVHLHAGAALIVFGIIADAGGDERPAPMIEEQLTKYWYDEMRDPIGCDSGDHLLTAFTDAARRLAILNKKRCTDKVFPCMANPYLDSLKNMESNGFDWGFDQSFVTKRDQAEALTSPALRAAICHGDAHLRNILVRGEQGFPIDYAYSGPGHPCADLVKLELSVYLTAFVPLGSTAELVALQRDLSTEGLPLEQLLTRHKQLLRSKTNQLCIKMCVAARDLLHEVLAEHKLPWEHYIAVKTLTAWSSLQVPRLQQSLARTVILGVGS